MSLLVGCFWLICEELVLCSSCNWNAGLATPLPYGSSMIHATIQYTQTDKSRPVIVSICLKIHGSIFVSPSRLPQYVMRAWLLSHNLAKRGPRKRPGDGVGRVGRAWKSCLRSQLGTHFPKFPVSLCPPDNLCKAKDGHRQRKKTMT